MPDGCPSTDRRRDAPLVPRLRDVRHHRARAARRARRAQARPPARALRDARAGAQPANRALQEVAPASSATCSASTIRTATRRSTTRSCAWRRTSRCATRSSTARATSAPSTATRRRPCATPRRGWRRSPQEMLARHRQGDRRLRRRTTTRRWEPMVLPARVPEPPGQRLGRHRGRAWRPTSRRTTSARSSTACSRARRTRTVDRRRADADHPGPRLPHRAASSTAARASGRPTRPGRGIITMRARAHIEKIARRAREPIVVTEIPYQVNKAALIEKIAELVERQEARRHHARCATSPTATACGSSSSSKGEIAQVVLNQLYKHTADADDLRRHHAGHRRPAAAGGAPQGDARATSSTTAGTS